MLLSVVIPIGNLKNNYNNLKEIIISSDDNSIELVFVLDTNEILAVQTLNELCQKQNYNNYKLVECNGRNPGSSRNMGMKSCTGEWLLFCDSDDIPLFTNIVTSIMEIESDFDVLIGSYVTKENQSNKIKLSLLKSDSDSTWDDIALNPGLWRWLIKKNFILTEHFPELSMGEDQYFIFTLLNRDPKIKFSKEIFYQYMSNSENSITATKSKIGDLVQILELELNIGGNSNKYNKTQNNIIVKQIFTLLKSGNLIAKYKVMILFVVFISKLSPTNYFSILKFITKIVKNSVKR